MIKNTIRKSGGDSPENGCVVCFSYKPIKSFARPSCGCDISICKECFDDVLNNNIKICMKCGKSFLTNLEEMADLYVSTKDEQYLPGDTELINYPKSYRFFVKLDNVFTTLEMNLLKRRDKLTAYQNIKLRYPKFTDYLAKLEYNDILGILSSYPKFNFLPYFFDQTKFVIRSIIYTQKNLTTLLLKELDISTFHIWYNRNKNDKYGEHVAFLRDVIRSDIAPKIDYLLKGFSDYTKIIEEMGQRRREKYNEEVIRNAIASSFRK